MNPEKEITLNVKTRDKTGKKISRKLNRKKKIPAVIYGKNFKNLNLIIDQKEFYDLGKQFSENSILTLQFPDQKKIKALIHDTQNNPVNDKTIHIDFLKIDPKRKVEATVPLKFIGESKAVKEENGILIRNINEVNVECLPTDIPEFIEADLTSLKNIDEHIKIQDLKIPENIELKDHHANDIVATAAVQKEEIIEEEKKPEEEEKEGEKSTEGKEKEEETKATEETEKKEQETEKKSSEESKSNNQQPENKK